MLMLSFTEAIGKMPSRLRSSGHMAMPASIARRGEPMRSFLPRSVTLPPVARSVPHSRRISSVRPAPTRPKNPTISPARTENEAGALRPGPVTPSMLASTAPCGRGW